MTSVEPPPVEAAQPPRLVLRVVNPLVLAILRSRLHRVLSGKVVVLTVTGRRSGRDYRIPVGRHEADGNLVVGAGGAWRVNLRGGATCRVRIDGTERRAHAELEENPGRVADGYKALLEQLGIEKARELGLKVNVDRMPTAEQIEPAVAGRAIATIRLRD